MDLHAGEAAQETSLPMVGALSAAAIAAIVVIPLAGLIGQATARWSNPGPIVRLMDSAVYGALVGLAVGAALLVSQRNRASQHPDGQQSARLARSMLAPAAAGAVTATFIGFAGEALDARTTSPTGLGLYLLGSMVLGAAVAGAARLGDPGNACCAALLGGAVGGFVVWLVANGLRGSVVSPTTFAGWAGLAADPAGGPHLLRDAVGAALPAVCIPLGIGVMDAARMVWRR